MNVVVHTPVLTEMERKKKMNYITDEMLKIAKRATEKKNIKEMKSAKKNGVYIFVHPTIFLY